MLCLLGGVRGRARARAKLRARARAKLRVILGFESGLVFDSGFKVDLRVRGVGMMTGSPGSPPHDDRIAWLAPS